MTTISVAENSAAIYVVYTYTHNRKVNDVCHVYYFSRQNIVLSIRQLIVIAVALA